MDTITRPKNAEDRVTVQNISDWQKLRSKHDQFSMCPRHNLIHIQKALGPIAAVIEHRDHGEPEPDIEDKRIADLIIHSIWLAAALGYDPAKLVAHRVWDIGIRPKREELPEDER